MELIDHHVHGVVRSVLARPAFELLINEGGWVAPPGTSHFDSSLGAAIRRWCAPVLGLDPLCPPDAYLGRRAELGDEANRLLLRAAGGAGLVGAYVDTGHRSGEVCTPEELGALAGVPAWEVVRVESVFEEAAAAAAAEGRVAELPDRWAALLRRRAAAAVGLKSVVAYRHGFDLDPTPPAAGEVAAAMERWLQDAAGTAPAGAPGDRPPRLRVADPVLLRHILWEAAAVGREHRLPLQLHAGFGDSDLDLHRVDPVVFTPWLRAWRDLELPVVFLHCWPYHRQAAYLAAIWPSVYFDLGASLNYVGARAPAVLAEALEVAPWSKLLYSSDAFGLAELVHLGAVAFVRGLDAVLSRWVESGELTAVDADRIRSLAGAGNARRLYAAAPGLRASGAGPAGTPGPAGPAAPLA